MARTKKQTEIPGTEALVDLDLEGLADDYHAACAARREAQDTERARQATLLDAVESRIREGKLNKPEGTATCVYKYVDDEGTRRFVHYVGRGAKIKVNTKKVAPEDSDDEGEQD